MASFSNTSFLLCGDWNVVQDTNIDTYNIIHNRNPNSRKKIEEIVESLELLDPWRTCYPNDRKYTWRQCSPIKQSWLDFFLVTEDLFSLMKNTNIIPGYKTDHSAITFTFSASLAKWGKGYWKFNSQLLRDLDYIKKVKTCINESILEYYESGNIDDLLNVKLSCNDQITELIDENGKHISDQSRVLQEEMNFYKTLYSSKNLECDDDSFFKHNVKLTEEEKDLCEGNISFKECAESLKSMSNGKSPGSDGQYADDTFLVLDGTETSLRETLNCFDSFQKVSGLKINSSKTKAVWVGNKKYSDLILCPDLKLQWCYSNFKLLGIEFSLDLDSMPEINFSKKIKEVSGILKSWQHRKLTLMGKSTVIKTLALPKLIHLLTALPNLPESKLNELNTLFFQFIWNGKPDRIRRSTLIGDIPQGGLNMMNIHYFNIYLKIGWIKRFSSNLYGSWQSLLLKNLEQYGGERVLHFQKEKLREISDSLSNPFWKDVFFSFEVARPATNISVQDILSLDILNFAPLVDFPYFIQWHRRGVQSLFDLINLETKDFCNFDQIGPRLQTNNFLKYYGLIANIPKYMREYIKEKIAHVNLETFNCIDIFLERLLCNKRAKFVYKDLVDRNVQLPTEKFLQWEESLGILLTEIDAAGNGSELDPFQQYATQGNEAVLQCIYENNQLKWYYINDTIIASESNVIDPKKYKVSATSAGLYYRLHVLDAQPGDELVYKCRSGLNEDYYIQLILYVPPTKFYFHGLTDSKLEGTEGTDLLIRCIAEGGKPPPVVTILDWTRPTSIQEVSYTIPSITRDYHQKSIACQASSAALGQPLTTTLQIYLNLKPLTPIFNRSVVSTEEPVPLRVSCTSYGSRPAAAFTWTIGGNDVTTSSTTSPPVKESNDTYTVTSALVYSVNRSHTSQTIVCRASNTLGTVSASKTLNVKYAPDITVNSPTYTQNEADRTVTCNASGNPDSYTYHKWQHKSKYGEIQEFVGSKTLKLPDVPVSLRYQDNGEYVCTVSNGIKGKNKKEEQTGSGNVIVNALPVVTTDNIDRGIQFGEIYQDVELYVNVYSVPKLTSFEWVLNEEPMKILNSDRYEKSSSPTIVKDTINGKEVQLDGYNITLTVHDLKLKDFVTYNVTLTNKFGSVRYAIKLESASLPETPGNFSKQSASATSITVQWDINSDGGYQQKFYVQYRIQGSLEWTTKLVDKEDTNESKQQKAYEVKNLQEGKAYELRMYAENALMKRSNATEVLIALTDSGSKPSVAAIIGGIAGGLTAIIIVLLVIVFVQKKRKESGNPSTKLRGSSSEEEEEEEEGGLKDNILYESSQSDGLKKNVLYQSAEPDFKSQKKSSTSCEYAVVQKPNAIYAEVNKGVQPKTSKEKKQKDKKTKPKKAGNGKAKAVNNNPDDEYANSALQMKNLNDGEYANSTDTQGPSGHNTSAQGLEYADLTFRQIPAKNKKQVIHGNDERTIYADVDHTKKAPPPPQESEYEETNIKHGKMA
ncbi:uncharacterized protein [Mytilus edulis]|uniref:uncharacterized protein n=1 Tax=Mytilus edulis TaxID=6550 RepID=UPI0039EEDF9D